MSSWLFFVMICGKGDSRTCDGNDQDGLLQVSVVDAAHQERLNDLLVQAGAQRSHAVELDLHRQWNTRFSDTVVATSQARHDKQIA